MGVGRPIRVLPQYYDEVEILGISDALPYCGGCLVVSGASYSHNPGLAQRVMEKFEISKFKLAAGHCGGRGPSGRGNAIFILMDGLCPFRSGKRSVCCG
ncbi:hypothetical protein [Paenibacillus sp. JCM 10914]